MEFLKSDEIFSGHKHGSISYYILVKIILNLDNILFWWDTFCKEKGKKIKFETNILKNIFWWIYLNFGSYGGRRGQKIIVAQNDLKNVLVLELLRSDKIFEILCVS